MRRRISGHETEVMRPKTEVMRHKTEVMRPRDRGHEDEGHEAMRTKVIRQ